MSSEIAARSLLKFTEPAYNRLNSASCEHKRKELFHFAGSIDTNGFRYSKAAVLASGGKLSLLMKRNKAILNAETICSLRVGVLLLEDLSSSVLLSAG